MVTFGRTVRINASQLSQIESRAVKNHRNASQELCAILEKAGIKPTREMEVAA